MEAKVNEKSVPHLWPSDEVRVNLQIVYQCTSYTAGTASDRHTIRKDQYSRLMSSSNGALQKDIRFFASNS